jgi:phosphoribosylformylglycinamidine synthase
MPDRDGYYTNWTHLRVTNDRSAATGAAARGAVLPIPVAHAEGRFVSSDSGLIDELFDRGQVVLVYARHDGSPEDGFPANPNASTRSIAGVASPSGNVVAMMPHPERAAWLFQVPEGLAGEWGRRRRTARGAGRAEEPGPGAVVMNSLRKFCLIRSREV